MVAAFTQLQTNFNIPIFSGYSLSRHWFQVAADCPRLPGTGLGEVKKQSPENLHLFRHLPLPFFDQLVDQLQDRISLHQ